MTELFSIMEKYSNNKISANTFVDSFVKESNRLDESDHKLSNEVIDVLLFVFQSCDAYDPECKSGEGSLAYISEDELKRDVNNALKKLSLIQENKGECKK